MNVLTTTGAETCAALSPSPWDEVVPDPEELWRQIAVRCWQRVHPDREHGDGDIPTPAEVAECFGHTGPLASGPAWQGFLSRWNRLIATAITAVYDATGSLFPPEPQWVDGEFDPDWAAFTIGHYIHCASGNVPSVADDIGLQSRHWKVQELIYLVKLVSFTHHEGAPCLYVHCGESLLKITAAHAALDVPLAGPSPVEPLIEAWHQSAVAARIPQVEPDLRTKGRRIPAKLGMVEPDHPRADTLWSTAAHLALVPEPQQGSLFYDQGAPLRAHPPVQRVLPGFGEWQPGRTPALPLQLWELGGARLTSGGGQGAPLALRLFVECILGLPAIWRDGEAAYEIPLSELRHKLYPVESRMSRRVFWQRLMRAAEILDSDAARIPWYDSKTGRGDRRRIVNITGLPHFPEEPGALLRIVIDLPPNSQAGPRVSDNLGKWGLHSAPAYRALLNLAYLWFEPGRTHYPVETGHGQHWVRSYDPEQYEPLTDDELIGLCYPTGVVSRNRHRQLERSLEAMKQLEEAGEVVIEPMGTSRKERRILPPNFFN